MGPRKCALRHPWLLATLLVLLVLLGQLVLLVLLVLLDLAGLAGWLALTAPGLTGWSPIGTSLSHASGGPYWPGRDSRQAVPVAH